MAGFVGEEITVNTSEEDGMPLSFVWRGERFEIEDILKARQDWGYPLNRPPRKQSWRGRRHRNVYLVSAGDNVFEIYRDRAGGGAWVLLRTVEKGELGEHNRVS